MCSNRLLVLVFYKFVSHILSTCSQSYVSILYLRIPPGFRIILRGIDVEHHSVVNDMMQTEQITYRPQSESYGVVTNVSFNNFSLYKPSYSSFFIYRPWSSSYNIKLVLCTTFFYQMSAIVIIGFVKDAKHHVDVQGFNVYHKNRLSILGFWFSREIVDYTKSLF